MGLSLSVWLVIVIALVAANLPFVNQRTLAAWPRRKPGRKGLGQQLLEWFGMYLLVGLFSLALERNAGQIYPQGWEFYATTLALFATFAFPGFVYSHLVRHANQGVAS